MALSLETITLSTQDAVTAVAALGTVAAVGCCAHSWLEHRCRPGHPVLTAPRSRLSAGAHCCPPSVFCCSTANPLCRPRARHSPATLSPGECV